MKHSSERILTTHVGSLPRTPELIELFRLASTGEPCNIQLRDKLVKDAVRRSTRRQVEVGLDIINDGEMGKPSFITYVNERLGGFERAPPNQAGKWSGSREMLAFPEFYQQASPGADTRLRMICTAPIRYTGHSLLAAEIDDFRNGLDGLDFQDAFVTSVSPSMIEYFQRNAFYKSEEEYVFAIAEAMREEYEAIVSAGFVVQIDDPGILAHHLRHPDLGLSEWRNWATIRVEALNHALRNIPTEKIRHHICHGINIGPRVHDMDLKDHLDLVLAVNAGAYSFENANPRHEHEWQVWAATKLPDGKLILPGVVTQSSVLVEHPELVAQRIERFARLVGRENVIASTDCGFASSATMDEIHPTVVWAKLQALQEGARLASIRLWGRKGKTPSN